MEERHGIVLAKNYAAKAFGVSTGEAIWQAKQAGTQKYRDFMNGTSVKLHFIKVKGHTGVEGNERADSLAKEAVSKKISFNQLVIE